MAFLNSVNDVAVYLLPLIVSSSFFFMLTVAVLVLVLVTIKFTIILWEKDKETAKSWMLPHIRDFVSGGIRELPNKLFTLRWPLRKILQYVIIHESFGKDGIALKRITDAYESLGFVKNDLSRLDSWFWWTRAEGARCLGQMKSASSQSRLLSKLRDPVTEVRLIAAWALGRIGNPEIIKPVIESLARSSRLAGMRLSSTVFELGRKAVPPLTELLSNPDTAVKILSVHLLGELADKRPISSIKKLTEPAQNLEVRLAALKALGTIGDPLSLDCLVNWLSDEAWQIRAQAAKSLGLIGDSRAVEHLSKSVGDSKWWVRRNAGEALTKTGIKGVEALKKLFIEQKKSPSGKMAAQWLDEIGYLPAAD
ncbi:MAG: HEAT repeat domain-containing protein [Endomicrobiales bacterium]|nr:HEAT repeat domain-containing protein [Endomicrobiales bacterium]